MPTRSAQRGAGADRADTAVIHRASGKSEPTGTALHCTARHGTARSRYRDSTGSTAAVMDGDKLYCDSTQRWGHEHKHCNAQRRSRPSCCR